MDRYIRVMRVLRELVALPAEDFDRGIGHALEGMRDLLGGGRAWLFIADPAGVFDLRVSSPAQPAGALPVFLRSDQPWLCPDLARGEAVGLSGPDHPGLLPEFRAFMQASELSGCTLAPLTWEGGLLGLLCCERLRDDPATADFVAEFAGVLAGVLVRAGAETQRAEVSARMAATLSAIPDLLFEVDAQGHYTGFNTGPRNQLLVTPQDFVGREVGSVLPDAVADRLRAAVRTVLDTGHVSDVVYALDLPGGRQFFDLSGARKEPARPGQAPTAVFLVRNVTQAHEMREELRRMSSVARAMSNLVAIVDTDLRITWVNPAFERHTGWTLDEIRGASLPDLVRCEESDPEVVAAVGEAIATTQPFSGQMVNKDRFGNRYYVDFSVLPLWGPEGDLQGYVSVETVVTQIKEQQIALSRLAKAAAGTQLRLENALNALPDAVMIFDADERLVVCNPARHATFPQLADITVPGIALRDLLRTAIERGLYADMDPARDIEAVVEELLVAYRQPSHVDEFRMFDGRWFRRVNNRTSDGGLITVMLDITLRNNQLAELDAANLKLWQALEAREMAEQRLHNIMDATRFGTWELDLEAQTVTVSKQWGQLVGLGNERDAVLSHREFLDMVHPDDRTMLESDTPQGQSTAPDIFEHEFRMQQADGQWIWVLSRGRIIRWSDTGSPLQLIGVDIDINDQKRLEDEVRQSDAYLQSALESNVAAFAIYDDKDILLYCNSEAERILRLKPGLRYGRRLEGPVWSLETIEGGRLPIQQGPCIQARRAGVMLRDIRFAVRWSDGRRQVLTCNATPVDAGEGKRNTVISFWDITDQLAATQQLQQALAHAEEMSRSKSIFLANMSHEIRTPLNGVLGLAEVLSMQIKNPEHSRMITTIRQSGETLLAVLNSILDMSKIEAGKMEIEHIPLTLQEMLEQIEAVYTIQAAEKDLEFEVVTSTGADVPRIGDPHRIRQILYNLLNNAFKFSSEGSVTLSVSCRPGKPVLFEVSDTGVGMTHEQSARVFQSFEQADGSMTRRFGGTGLGLSIVRELVMLMGGEISLESEPDVGTTVRVSLPLPMAGTGQEIA